MLNTIALYVMTSLVTQASALILDPTVRAAETLGYQVVGEVEFRTASARLKPDQLKLSAADFARVCNRAPAHLIVLAWGDREFPSPTTFELPAKMQALADERARAVAQALRARLPGELSFDLVNMASRKSQLIHPGSRQISPTSLDVKQAMIDEGAAPTSALEVGLFGEYAQAAKAVIWTDCDDVGPTQRASLKPAARPLLANIN